MDALSSQSLVAGYRAVLEAAIRFPRFFPLYMTAAGTIPPARVLVLGEPLTCVVCRKGQEFERREANMNTKGMTFLGLDWLNRSGDGAVCLTCGYVHVFMGVRHEWV